MSAKNKRWITGLLVVVALLIAVPFLVQKDAEFGGSDDAGSVMVEEISGAYEPWFTPILETLMGGELPGEIESLLFCVQTGIGVGILAFCLGRMVERKKWTDKREASVNNASRPQQHESAQ